MPTKEQLKLLHVKYHEFEGWLIYKWPKYNDRYVFSAEKGDILLRNPSLKALIEEVRKIEKQSP